MGEQWLFSFFSVFGFCLLFKKEGILLVSPFAKIQGAGLVMVNGREANGLYLWNAEFVV